MHLAVILQNKAALGHQSADCCKILDQMSGWELVKVMADGSKILV